MSYKDITETPMRTRLPLPRGWNRRAGSSIVHILALSHYTFTALLARAAQPHSPSLSTLNSLTHAFGAASLQGQTNDPTSDSMDLGSVKSRWSSTGR